MINLFYNNHRNILWWNQPLSSERESSRKELSNSHASNLTFTVEDLPRAGEDPEVHETPFRYWQPHEEKIQRQQEDAQNRLRLWQRHQVFPSQRLEEIRRSQRPRPQRPPHEQQNLLRRDRPQRQLTRTHHLSSRNALKSWREPSKSVLSWPTLAVR